MRACQAQRTLTTEQIEGHLGNQKKRYRQATPSAALGMETHPIESLSFSAYEAIAPDVPDIRDRFPGTADELSDELGPNSRSYETV